MTSAAWSWLNIEAKSVSDCDVCQASSFFTDFSKNWKEIEENKEYEKGQWGFFCLLIYD